MKKNNTNFNSDEIDLRDIIKFLWREKILILSFTIIGSLFGYLYFSFQTQKSYQGFKIEITIKKPPNELFNIYNPYSRDNKNNIAEKFISDFNTNFLSTDNLQIFVEESKELNDFKEYLKSGNISTKQYFVNKIGKVEVKNLVISDKYFLIFTKKLNGSIFFNNYVEFIKKKTLSDIKNDLRILIENEITYFEKNLQLARLLNLENPFIISKQSSFEPNDLFYKGSKVLSEEIVYLKKKLIKLEKEEFNFQIISNELLIPLVNNDVSILKYLIAGLMLGLFFSLGIIFFKSVLKNNK